MDTPERYNTQLAVVSAVCVAAIASALGAFFRQPWARSALIFLTWAATVFWASAAYSLYKAQTDTPALGGIHILPVVFAFVCSGMAVALHFSEKRPSDAAV